MKDIKDIIGNNIALLRKQNDMTQQELANELAYSDKSISKWERGEAIPDVEVLIKIADLFQISIDSLVSENQIHTQNETRKKIDEQIQSNKIIITLLSVSAVWLVCTILFITGKSFNNKINWPVFIWAIPLSCIILLIFNCIWGKKTWLAIITSLMMWSIISCLYIQFYIDNDYNMWYIFFLGIPLQVAIILWHLLIKISIKKRKLHS